MRNPNENASFGIGAMMFQDEALRAQDRRRVVGPTIMLWTMVGLGFLLFVFTARAALKLAEAALG